MGVSEFLCVRRGDRLFHGAGARCFIKREASGAVGKSVHLLRLRDGFGESIFVTYGELVQGRFPVVGGTAPVRGDFSQGQPDQLGRHLVAGEMATRLDDLTQSRFDALNRVGGVNHAPRRRKSPLLIRLALAFAWRQAQRHRQHKRSSVWSMSSRSASAD